jgi:hypothetical protein
MNRYYDDERKKIQESLDLKKKAGEGGTEAYKKSIETLRLLDEEKKQAGAKITEDEYKAKLSVASNYTKMAGDAFTMLASTQDQTSRQGFESAKAFNLAAAVMSTAAAVMNAFATVPWPGSLAAAAMAAATGVVQIATIASTTFGGGGTVSAPAGSFASVSGGSGGGTGLGNLAIPENTVADSLQLESFKRLTDSTDNVASVIGKLSKSIESLAAMYDEGGQGYALAANAPGASTAIRVTPGMLESVFGGGSYHTSAAGMVLGASGGNVTADTYETKFKEGGFFSHSSTRTTYTEDPELEHYIQGLTEGYINDIVRMATTLGTTAWLGEYSPEETKIARAGRKPEDVAADLEAWTLRALQGFAMTVDGLEENVGAYDNAYLMLKKYNDALVSTNTSLELIGKTQLQGSFANAKAADSLQVLMGGSEAFTETMGNYFKSMFTDAEQATMEQAQAKTDATNAFGEMNEYLRTYSQTHGSYVATGETLSIAETLGLKPGGLADDLATAFGHLVGLNSIAVTKWQAENPVMDSIALPQTRQAFQELVTGLDITTESGRALFAALMDVSDAAASIYTEIERLAADQKTLDQDVAGRMLTVAGKDNDRAQYDMRLAQEQEMIDQRAKGVDVTQLAILQTAEYNKLLQDQAEASPILAKRKDLDAQILTLTESTSEARARELAALQALDINLAPLQERLYALQDAATAAAKALATEAQNNGLRITLWELEGKTVEALALKRQIETAEMTGETLALQNQIYALQDKKTAEEAATAATEKATAAAKEAAAAAKEAVDAAVETARTAQSEAEQLLRRSIDAELKALQERADAAAKAYSDAESLLDRSYAAQRDIIITQQAAIMDGLQAGLDSATKAADTLKQSFDMLQSARKSMTLDTTEAQAGNMAAAQADLFSILQSARRGDTSRIAGMSDTLGTVSKISSDSFATSSDYQKSFWQTSNAIAELEGITGKQLTDAQKQVETLTKLIETTQAGNDAVLKAFDAELNSIKGIESNTVPILEARIKYEATKAAEARAQLILTTQTTWLNRQYDMLTNVNQSVVSVAVGISGLQMAMAAMATALANQTAQTAMTATATATATLPGYALGGITSGLSYAGEAGPEAVVPLPDGRTIPVSMRVPMNGAADNREVVVEIRSLRQEQKIQAAEIAKNTQKMAKYMDQWENDGMLIRSDSDIPVTVIM